MNPWRDYVNIATKLTIRKIVNAAALFGSYHLSRFRKKPIIWGNPLSISIEPTTSCNLRCPECPSGLRSFSRPVGMLKQDTFTQLLQQIHKDLVYLLFYFQGEPYVNKNFLSLVRLASEKGIYTATSTNAHFLDEKTAKETVESGLDRLIISIDGASQETYEQYRREGNLSKVIEGTKNVLYWKKKLKSPTPHVIFQFLVVKPNEEDIPHIYKLANELGVDEVKLKTAQIYEYEKGSPLIPDNPKYSRYKKQQDGTYRIKNKLLNQCWKMWHSCVITWDGKVVPCCFDKDAHYVLGSTMNHNFRTIWRNEAYDNFRSNLLHSRSEIEICKNCTEGTKVWTEA